MNSECGNTPYSHSYTRPKSHEWFESALTATAPYPHYFARIYSFSGCRSTPSFTSHSEFQSSDSNLPIIRGDAVLTDLRVVFCGFRKQKSHLNHLCGCT